MTIIIIIILIITLCFCSFAIGAACGVKAEKKEIEKMVHSGILYCDGNLYEVKERK